MNLLKNTVASGMAGGVILAGTPANGQPGPSRLSTSNLSSILNLPIGRLATYYNRATDTAITERCEHTDPQTVQCRVRIMSNSAQIDEKQIHEYSNRNGAFRLSVTSNGTTPWTPDTIRYDFKPARGVGEGNAHTLSESSALFAKEQNAIGRLDTARGEVSLNSMTPVSDNRSLKLSVKFDDASGAVSLGVVSAAAFNGSTVSAGAQSSRPYHQYDGEHFDRYTAKAAVDRYLDRSPK